MLVGVDEVQVREGKARSGGTPTKHDAFEIYIFLVVKQNTTESAE